MKVLITGVTGLIGYHLAAYLKQLGGHEIHGLLRLGSGRAAPDGVRTHTGDVRDMDSLASVIGVVQPDRIFQMAAQSNVDRARSDPGETLATNVLGTANLLECVRRVREAYAGHYNPRIFISSSSEV